MAVYTVHEPPLLGSEISVDPERFAFVRDGFYFWAFLLTPLWMLRHRLWLVLLLALALVAVVDAAAYFVGATTTMVFGINTLISLLAGFEASTLRRWTLARAHWKNVGIVIGDDLESAERRFFDSWVASDAPSPAAPAAPPVGPTARMLGPSDVIGLFPQPGARH